MKLFVFRNTPRMFRGKRVISVDCSTGPRHDVGLFMVTRCVACAPESFLCPVFVIWVVKFARDERGMEQLNGAFWPALIVAGLVGVDHHVGRYQL